MHRCYLFSLITLIINILFSSNHNFSINTSRPGSFNPTSTIDLNKYQIELGVNNNSIDDYLWIFVRNAINDHQEIQYTISASDFAISHMYGNIKIGNQSESSVITTLNYGICDKKINNISFCFPFMYKINKYLSLNSHINVNIHPDNKINQTQYSYAFAINTFINNKTVFFSEIYGNSGTSNSSNENYFDFGFVYLTSGELQFDISAGTSISENFNFEDYYFVEIGFSFYL